MMVTRHRGGQQTTAWIGLGTNLGDGPLQINKALELLRQEPSIRVLRSSPLYISRPWGVTLQPDFTNAVAELSVECEPLQLLARLKHIEQFMGRDPSVGRWGPRIIDLDLLLLGDTILHLPGLTVPHRRMHQRAFVLLPMFELEPDLSIPARGSVRACLGRIGQQGVARWTGENLP